MDISKVTTEIDNVAEEVQKQDPVIAYALDKVSDDLEKKAGMVDDIIEGMKSLFKKNRIPEPIQKKILKETQGILISVPGKGWVPSEEIPMSDDK